MKKIIIGVIIVTLSLSGCFNTSTSDSERIGEIIIQSIEEKNEELLKSILSEKALNSEDLDVGIKYSFDLFDGKIIDANFNSKLQ